MDEAAVDHVCEKKKALKDGDLDTTSSYTVTKVLTRSNRNPLDAYPPEDKHGEVVVYVQVRQLLPLLT